MRKLYLKSFLIVFILSFTNAGCSKDKGTADEIKDNTQGEDIKGFDAKYVYDLSNPILTRNFYALAKIMDQNQASALLESKPALSAIRSQMIANFNNEIVKNTVTVNSIGLSLKFTDSQINSIIEDIGNSADETSLKTIIDNHLKLSGAYQLYSDYTRKNYLKYAVRECLKGINQIIDVYTQNVVPLDAISDLGLYHATKDTYKAEYLSVLKAASLKLEFVEDKLVFEPSLKFALMLLKLNTREEAGAFEPLETGENLKAITYLKNIKWDDYPYASMLLLGDSPNSAGDDINLSKSAKIRVGYAVDNLKAGLVPVVIISGANVYPNLTPYFEAIEMKKYMMLTYDIDEKQIIVDPHGRHTTSNVRNAARIIFKYKIPNSKKSIIVGTSSHINTIADPAFAKRCNTYYGYMPGVLGSRVSPTTLEYTPDVKSLTMQPSVDPLDP